MSNQIAGACGRAGRLVSKLPGRTPGRSGHQLMNAVAADSSPLAIKASPPLCMPTLQAAAAPSLR